MSRRLKNRPRCRHCGKALARVYQFEAPGIGAPASRGEVLGHGYGATGFFCSLTCGHAWAVTSLRQAERFDAGAVELGAERRASAIAAK